MVVHAHKYDMRYLFGKSGAGKLIASFLNWIEVLAIVTLDPTNHIFTLYPSLSCVSSNNDLG